jgi:hypothetical protein
VHLRCSTLQSSNHNNLEHGQFATRRRSSKESKGSAQCQTPTGAQPTSPQQGNSNEQSGRAEPIASAIADARVQTDERHSTRSRRTSVVGSPSGHRASIADPSDTVLPLYFLRHVQCTNCARVWHQREIPRSPFRRCERREVGRAEAASPDSQGCSGLRHICRKVDLRNQRDVLQKEVPKRVLLDSANVDMHVRGGFEGPLRKSSDKVGDPISARVKQSYATSVRAGRPGRDADFFNAQEDA